MSIRETIEKFIETKEKQAELEKRHEKYRKIIEEHMSSQGLTELKQGDITVRKTLSTRESVCKKDLPSDVWEKYCKHSRFTMITVRKSKGGDK
jgi:macrodomain Ter protein organizer (MatP/YcbG family)